jgi:hypothetical protein
MKLRSPFGCGAASHAGSSLEIDADGYVDVDDDVATVLLVHGFEPASKVIDDAARRERSDDGIDQLKRGDLFALLKANGMSVSLPITNDELRRLARQIGVACANSPLLDVTVKGS